MEDEDRPPDTVVTTSDKEPDGAKPKDTTGDVTNEPNGTDTGATDTSAHNDVKKKNNNKKNIENIDDNNNNDITDKLVDTPFIKRVDKTV